jgi:hypothetical protein
MLQIQVFWNVTSCRLVNKHRHFGGTGGLHLHGLAVTSVIIYSRWNAHVPKEVLFCHYAAERTSNIAKWDVMYVGRLFWAVICTGVANTV